MNETKIDIRMNKIQAIKAVRQFCHDTFGVNSGLKETKDFVESMMNSQAEETLRVAIRTAMGSGVNRVTIMSIADSTAQ